MTETLTPTASEQLARAIHLVASRQLAAVTALQRWMGLSFNAAATLLDEMEARGMVGPPFGSRSREVYIRRCEQCGRIGKRGFRTLASEEHDIRITECSNRSACRKRWPKPARDDD